MLEIGVKWWRKPQLNVYKGLRGGVSPDLLNGHLYLEVVLIINLEEYGYYN